MKHKFDSLTSLRFWMILIIMISHLEYLKEFEIYNRFFYRGYVHVAVIFFFMLSGFGISYNWNNKTGINIRSLLEYGINKIKKIWVIYIVMILLCIPWAIYANIEQGKNCVLIILGTIIKLIFCIPLLQSATGIFAISHAFNGVSWFLSTLFILYLVTPVLMRVNEKIKHSIKLDILYGIINLFVASGVYYILQIIDSKLLFDDLSEGSPYIRVFAFIMGIIIANLAKQIKWKKSVAHLLEIIVIVTNVVWLICITEININLMLKNVIMYLLAGSLILVCTYKHGILNRFLSTKWNIELGKMSMYIFLIHYPIRLYVNIIFEKCFNRDVFLYVLETIIIIASTFAISYLLYRRKIYKNDEVSKNVNN